MKTKFNFESQICTTREQSERLLELGIKKETADCCWTIDERGNTTISLIDDAVEYIEPAWSLGRLLEMLPSSIPISNNLPTFQHYAYLNLSDMSVGYYWENYDGAGRALVGFSGNGFFAAVVDATEWLIKEGNFPKEYLEE